MRPPAEAKHQEGPERISLAGRARQDQSPFPPFREALTKGVQEK